jgi:hypothetical protein
MRDSHRRYDIDDLLPSYRNVGREERILSAGIGAALLGAGLARRSIGGAIMAAAGAALMARGWSGYCPGLDALGIDHSDQRADRSLRMPPLRGRSARSRGGSRSATFRSSPPTWMTGARQTTRRPR